MAELTVYGDIKTSRTWWTAWTCGELGLEFDNVPLDYAGPEIKSEEYLALNPNGLIPTIKDGDFTLWEAMAINLYLAKKSGTTLYPKTLEGEARAWQWSLWSVTRVEVPLLTLMVANQDHGLDSEMGQYFLKHVPAWTPEELARCRSVLQGPFQVLNGETAKRPFLLGDTFTIADLNVSVILARNSGAQLDLTSLPHLADWLERCWSRPACPRRDTLLQALKTVT